MPLDIRLRIFWGLRRLQVRQETRAMGKARRAPAGSPCGRPPTARPVMPSWPDFRESGSGVRLSSKRGGHRWPGSPPLGNGGSATQRGDTRLAGSCRRAATQVRRICRDDALTTHPGRRPLCVLHSSAQPPPHRRSSFRGRISIGNRDLDPEGRVLLAQDSVARPAVRVSAFGRRSSGNCHGNR